MPKLRRSGVPSDGALTATPLGSPPTGAASTLRPVRTIALLVALAEKTSLLAAAALFAVLFPPLRKRLLGLGQRRDKLVAMAFGLVLSIWGTLMGFRVLGEHINVRGIGILIAAILGGLKAGTLAGLGGGLFYAVLVGGSAGVWGLLASLLDGVLAGYIASRRPRLFHGWRIPVTAVAVQSIHVVVAGGLLLVIGDSPQPMHMWPAHMVKIVVNAAGATLFVVVARIVVAREEAAVALLEARAAADAAALDALRRRLEPHFLFNALNALRATIRTNPSRARELVADLADLYRYLLSHPDDAPLHDEVNHACAYLAIERARLGDARLRVLCDVDEDTSTVRIPALLLQPLVENAVKHGVAAHEGSGQVCIAAKRDGDMLRIDIEDISTGRHIGASDPGSGIALRTLRERLAKRFSMQASLEMKRTPQGMLVTVSLPWPATEGAGSGAAAPVHDGWKLTRRIRRRAA